MLCLHALSNSNSIRNERTRFNDEFRYKEFEQDMAFEDYWLLKGNVYSMLPSIRPLQFNIAITLLSWSQDSWHSIKKNVERSRNLASASWNKSERLVNVGDVAINDTSSIDQSARRFFLLFFFFFIFLFKKKKKKLEKDLSTVKGSFHSVWPPVLISFISPHIWAAVFYN